jgi:hypothetical protein
MKIEFRNAIIESDNYEFLLLNASIGEARYVINAVAKDFEMQHSEEYQRKEDAQQRYKELMNILAVWSRERTAERYIHDKQIEHEYKKEREFLQDMQHNRKINES